MYNYVIRTTDDLPNTIHCAFNGVGVHELIDIIPGPIIDGLIVIFEGQPVEYLDLLYVKDLYCKSYMFLRENCLYVS